MTTVLAVERMLQALQQRRFFKLIGGGSLTEPEVIESLVWLYAQAGVHCIDVAPEMSVLQAIERAFTRLPEDCPRPVVMVSIPLDADPHFQKIALDEAACILCDACLPVCPTVAFSHVVLSHTDLNQLEINQALCYGCGRCVPVCPTQALSLGPLYQAEAQWQHVLSHPLVQAVEVHSRFTDEAMLPDFLGRHGAMLQNKLLALCFSPNLQNQEDTLLNNNWLPFAQAFWQWAQTHSPYPMILQIDGQPMSGSADPEASIPALQAAVHIRKIWPEFAKTHTGFYTLSGGINSYTAGYLRKPEYDFIAGVGMGTVARQQVWPWLTDLSERKKTEALYAANTLLQPFIEEPFIV